MGYLIFQKKTGTGSHAGAWDLTNASYDSVTKSIGSQDGSAQEIMLSSDGTKLYVSGNSGYVYQYTLSTPWLISSATYDSISYDISSKELYPQGLFFSSDGTKMYISGTSSASVHCYTLSSAWDLTTASFTASFSVSSQELNPSGIHFNSDGTKLFVVGYASDNIHQYVLSSAWDLTTASYDNASYSIGSQEPSPSSIFFKSDGSRIFIVGNGTDNVYQYDLITPWDISSGVSYNNIWFYVGSQDGTPLGMAFKSTGDKMYLSGISSDYIYQYSLST